MRPRQQSDEFSRFVIPQIHVARAERKSFTANAGQHIACGHKSQGRHPSIVLRDGGQPVGCG